MKTRHPLKRHGRLQVHMGIHFSLRLHVEHRRSLNTCGTPWCVSRRVERFGGRGRAMLPEMNVKNRTTALNKESNDADTDMNEQRHTPVSPSKNWVQLRLLPAISGTFIPQVKPGSVDLHAEAISKAQTDAASSLKSHTNKEQRDLKTTPLV